MIQDTGYRTHDYKIQDTGHMITRYRIQNKIYSHSLTGYSVNRFQKRSKKRSFFKTNHRFELCENEKTLIFLNEKQSFWKIISLKNMSFMTIDFKIRF